MSRLALIVASLAVGVVLAVGAAFTTSGVLQRPAVAGRISSSTTTARPARRSTRGPCGPRCPGRAGRNTLQLCVLMAMTPEPPASELARLRTSFGSRPQGLAEPSREGSMRRVLGLTLTGLGAFFFVLAAAAALLPARPGDQVPAERVRGDHADRSQRQLLQPRSRSPRCPGSHAKATSTIDGDVARGLLVDRGVERLHRRRRTRPTTSRSSTPPSARPLTGATGLLVNCCGAYVNVQHRTHASTGRPATCGRSGPRSRPTRCSTPRCSGRSRSATREPATVDGLTTYKFVEHVTNQQFASQTLPGALVGSQPAVR